MNSIISDNTVAALKEYLFSGLMEWYDEREAQNISAELFREFKKWSRTDVVMHMNDRISESELLQFHFALKRLKSGEPLQYVIGKSWFFGREFDVDKHVLIPRPETEELVKNVITACELANPRILDIGTGSGCIAITLKKEMPRSEVVAVDISKEALEVAQKNALKMEAEIAFHKMDILEGANGLGEFDVLVTNPPYIPLSEKSSMRHQVVDFEPHVALFVEDDDPLIFYRKAAELGKQLLKTDGFIFAEIHEDLSEELENMLLQMGITRFHFLTDLQDKKRMIKIEMR